MLLPAILPENFLNVTAADTNLSSVSTTVSGMEIQ
jgi:hypothetical protein